jgi:RND superfamily putative drug exporter
MIVVFASFVLGDQRVIKMFGLGLAAAILIDATLVRVVLVPATMELLGKANWWFPKWLEWIPRLHVEARGKRTHARNRKSVVGYLAKSTPTPTSRQSARTSQVNSAR